MASYLFSDEFRTLLAQMTHETVNHRNLVIDAGTKQVLRRARLFRMSTKRRLLLRLAAARRLKVRVVLTEEEVPVFLSLLPWWKRIIFQLGWTGHGIGAAGI